MVDFQCWIDVLTGIRKDLYYIVVVVVVVVIVVLPRPFMRQVTSQVLSKSNLSS